MPKYIHREFKLGILYIEVIYKGIKKVQININFVWGW